jgi:hypothetical protein
LFCIHCGTELPDDAAFCSRCGRALASNEAASAQPVASTAAEPSPQPAASVAPASTGGESGGAARWSDAGRAPFRFAGRWWTRGPLDEVLLYDDATRDWRMALATQTPFFMRRPRFSSLRTPAVWLYVLFGLFIAVTLIALAADVDRAMLMRDIANGERVSFSDEQASYDFFTSMKGFQAIAMLAIVPFFVWWTRRATCNVGSLGAKDPEFTPRWSVAWWFIPFANWVQPCRVLLQAWRASDPALPPDLSDRYRRSPTSVWIVVWWVAYMVGSGVWGAALSLASDEESTMTASEIASATWFAFAMDGVMIGVALFAILVVAKLTSRQERADEKFDLRGGLPAVPGSEGPADTPYAIPGATPTGW